MKILFIALFLVACGVFFKSPKRTPEDIPHNMEEKDHKIKKEKKEKKDHEKGDEEGEESPSPEPSPVPTYLPPAPAPSSSAPTPTLTSGPTLESTKLECESPYSTFNPLHVTVESIETLINPDGEGGLILLISLVNGNYTYEITCHITNPSKS